MIEYTLTTTWLGQVIIAVKDRQALWRVEFCEPANRFLEDLHLNAPHAQRVPGEKLETFCNAVAEYFHRPSRPFSLPLHLTGTPFQLTVWRALQTVPFGTVISYSELAGRAGLPGKCRAVAAACAANRLAVIIPCHRVVRADGSLGGYRWGIERKRRLIEYEKRQAPHA